MRGGSHKQCQVEDIQYDEGEGTVYTCSWNARTSLKLMRPEYIVWDTFSIGLLVCPTSLLHQPEMYNIFCLIIWQRRQSQLRRKPLDQLANWIGPMQNYYPDSDPPWATNYDNTPQGGVSGWTSESCANEPHGTGRLYQCASSKSWSPKECTLRKQFVFPSRYFCDGLIGYEIFWSRSFVISMSVLSCPVKALIVFLNASSFRKDSNSVSSAVKCFSTIERHLSTANTSKNTA